LFGSTTVLGVSDAELVSQRGLEKLVVGGPHERVVDHRRALKDGVLEVGAVVGYFVGDAIDEDGVGHRLVHARAAELGVLGDDAGVAPLDRLNECRRPRPLAPDQQADLQRRAHAQTPPPAAAGWLRCH
jgi:hypothetical protein